MGDHAGAGPSETPLERIAAAWPPDAAGDDSAEGYRRGSLDETRPVAAVALPGGGSVALAEGPAGAGLHIVPIAPAEGAAVGTMRRARPGDGVAAGALRAIAGGFALPGGWRVEPAAAMAATALAPEAVERAIGTDQTNESAIVADAAIVKWIRAPLPGRDRADRLLRHLWQAGFGGVPAYHGRLVVERPDGLVTAAHAFAYVAGATDGWTWAVDAVLAHLAEEGRCRAGCPASFARGLGALVAGLHAAFASPTATIATPVATTGEMEVERWRTVGRATLAEAVARTVADEPALGDELEQAASRLGERIDGLAAVTRTAVQPIHGDLHVGQVLRAAGRLAIVDLDGNPTVADPPEREPAARDLAGLLCSIDHVGRIVLRRAGPAVAERVERWIVDAEAACMDGYLAGLAAAGRTELLDDRLLAPFRAEQEARELLYAARFLPRWRYAPMGAIRAMVR